MTPQVSIIIPAYKPGHLLQALASAFAQRGDDYEVIVVNDGSPFSIRDLLRPLVEDGRILYIEQENKGTAAARNRGLGAAHGKYVAFLDDDDYWPDDKLEWQARYLDEDPGLGMIAGNATIVDEAGNVKTEEPVKAGFVTLEGMFSGCNITSPGQTLIRREVMGEQALDENLSGADDVDLWLTLAGKSRVMMVPRLALYYRLHETNASRDNLSICLKTQRAIGKHLALASRRDRARYWSSAASWLFPLRGIFIIREWKRRLVCGEWRHSGKYLSAITWFVRGALPDPSLLSAVGREILPWRFFAK